MLVSPWPTAHELRARIFSVLPAASVHLDKLLGLADVVVTTQVPTAAIECRAHPRLLVNPHFVAQHCRTDEHLFMLVMHEIAHVTLGHTRLFPRPTPASNVAFDAVINAALCRQFPGPEYTSFFSEFYAWEHPVARLLRPPPGWPDQPQPLPAGANAVERDVHARLYGAGQDITYVELLALLQLLGGPGAWEALALLGDHDGTPDEQAVADSALRALLEGIASQLTALRLPPSVPPERKLRAALRRLLSRAGLEAGGRGPRQRLRAPFATPIETVVPQPRDRRALALARSLGHAPLLWRGTLPQVRRQPHPSDIAHAYLDVSGSMDRELPLLASVLAPLQRAGVLRLYVFSTEVAAVTPRDVAEGRLPSTGGTDIDCVLRHLLALPPRSRPRRAVLVTDGFVGVAHPDLVTRLRTALYVGLYSRGCPPGEDQLAPLARHMVTLPALP